MTTTCIPRPTTVTCSTERSIRLIDIRAAVGALLQRITGVRRGNAGLERRARRSTPSDTALDSIESFPGMRR